MFFWPVVLIVPGLLARQGALRPEKTVFASALDWLRLGRGIRTQPVQKKRQGAAVTFSWVREID